MFIKPVTSTELCVLSKQIKNKLCSGDDKIPASVMKRSLVAVKKN